MSTLSQRGELTERCELAGMLDRLFARFRKSQRPALPQILESAEYERLMPTLEFFPRPEWGIIRDKIEREHPDDPDQAWQDFSHIWLTRLSYRLENGYEVRRSDEFILLSSLGARRSGFVLNILEGIRNQVLDVLGWTNEQELQGLYTVLLFADSTDYLRYVSAFGSQGEDEASVGMYLPGDYGHMVILEQEIWRMESTFAYILTQYILDHSELPTWLRSGLCLHFSEVYFQGDRITEIQKGEALAELRRAFWLERGIQGFWTGTDFGESDARERAEDLALSLTRLVLGEARSSVNLLGAASWKDAGFSSVTEFADRELQDIVSDLLGPGDWEFEAPTDWLAVQS